MHSFSPYVKTLRPQETCSPVSSENQPVCTRWTQRRSAGNRVYVFSRGCVCFWKHYCYFDIFVKLLHITSPLFTWHSSLRWAKVLQQFYKNMYYWRLFCDADIFRSSSNSGNEGKKIRVKSERLEEEWEDGGMCRKEERDETRQDERRKRQWWREETGGP